MEEVWKDIVGFEGYYQISNFGNVKSLDRDWVHNLTGKILIRKGQKIKQCMHPKGYMYVYLMKNAKKTTLKIHRLVAIHFIENPNNKEQVNHKDGNKTNNHVNNLEWMTNSENSQHGFDNNLHPHPKRPVLQFDKLGNFIAEYESMMDAQRKTGVSVAHISGVANNKKNYKSAGGFIFKFKPE